MPQSFKNNIKQLKTLSGAAPAANKAKIQNITDLYENKKIPNFKTALNLAVKLFSPSLYKTEDINKSYNDIINKYKEAIPITRRLKREIENPPIIKNYECKVILYTQAPTKEQAKEQAKDDDIFIGDEDLHQPLNMLSGNDQKKYRKYLNKRFKGLRQYFIGTLNLKIRHDKTVNFLSDHINKLITKKERQKLRFTIKVFQTDHIFSRTNNTCS